MKRPDSLVFYFPYHGVGGVSVLFLRLAEHLRSQYHVYLADYSDGYMARRLPAHVHLIAIDRKPVFPNDAVYVFQSFLPWRFPFQAQVARSARVLFWNLHPRNFNPEFFNSAHAQPAIAFIAKVVNGLAVARRRKTRAVLSYLLRKQALVFMDCENVRTTSQLCELSVTEPRYLPVMLPSGSRPPRARSNTTVHKPLKCGWVGRVADFKWHILKHAIARLHAASATVGPIELTVIGDGEFKGQVQAFATPLTSKVFSVIFMPELQPAAVEDYLHGEVDVLFAMGTSALEGARAGVPTFSLDYSYQPIVGNYRFKLLSERPENVLAEEIGAGHLEATTSLEQSLKNVIADYGGYSRRSREYFEEHYSLEAMAPRFIEYCGETRATFGEMQSLGMFESDWLGKTLRGTAWSLRGHARTAIVGFRNDC